VNIRFRVQFDIGWFFSINIGEICLLIVSMDLMFMYFMGEKQFKICVSRVVLFALFFSLLTLGSLSLVCAVDHSVPVTTFESINSTIENAGDNDRILLGNNTYIGVGNYIRVVNKTNLTIEGQSDTQRAVLNANHLNRIILVDENSTVTFRFIDFINGDSGTLSGAAISARNAIEVYNCSFRNNWGESGGAIFIRDDTPHCIIANSLFVNNEGRYMGSDLWVEGGAIDSHAESISIINCTFIGNSALTTGGAINLAGMTLWNEIIGCTFIDNYAPIGGAIRANNNVVLIKDCIFTNNYANETHGGALHLRLSGVIIENCTFTGNHAVSNGGAIYDNEISSSRYLNITNSIFNNNRAGNGGAVYSQNLLSIMNCNFTSNRADSGNVAGIYSTNTKLIRDSNFTNNIGTAISISGTGIVISGNNIAGNSGQGIISANVQNGIINNNTIRNSGGTGLNINGNGNRIYNNTFTSNNIGVIANGNNLNFTNNLVSNSRSDGLRLTSNNLIFVSNNISSNGGHGLVLNGVNPTIANCNFGGNNFGINGLSLANGLIRDNVFSANRGAGLYAK